MKNCDEQWLQQDSLLMPNQDDTELTVKILEILKHADVKLKEKKYSEARASYLEVLDFDIEEWRDERRAELYEAIAYSYYCDYDDRMAVDYFKLALRYNRSSALSCYYLGRIHYSQKKFKKAAAAFRESVKIDPDNGYAHFGLRWSYRMAGDEESAANAHIEEINLGRRKKGLPPIPPEILNFGIEGGLK